MGFKKLIKESLREIAITEPEKEVVNVAAGVLIKCTSTNRVLLLLRNDKKPTWALMSGGIEEGEDVMAGLIREIDEEMNIDGSIIDFNFMTIERVPRKNLEFHYYEGFVDKEFKPVLDHENLNYGWFDIDNLPSPLYPGLDIKVNNIVN